LTDEVRKTFGGFSSEQLNWKPSGDVWSVGQILDHLIITNDSYIPTLEAVGDGTYIPNSWTRIPLLTDFIGSQFKKALNPASEKKIKAPASFVPESSSLEKSILDRFYKSQNEVAGAIGLLKQEDLKKKIASPISEMITLRVGVAIEVILIHEQRHLSQANRLLDSAMFPV
jgi:hypothetical protein